LYRNPREVAAEAVKAMSTGLQFGRDVKLLPALGKGPGAAQPRRAPFWRSGQTLRAMQAWAAGLLDSYQAGDYDYGEDAWIDGSVAGELARLRDTFAAMPGSIESIAADEDGYR